MLRPSMTSSLRFFLGLILGLSVGVVLTVFLPQLPHLLKPEPINYTGKVVITENFQFGDPQPTGLEIPFSLLGQDGLVPVVLVSPNQELVLYTTWENAKVVMHVTKPNGSDNRAIATQNVAEGSGELLLNTLQWSSDSQSFTYTEVGIVCKNASCLSPDDFVTETTLYHVDAHTGEKSILAQD